MAAFSKKEIAEELERRRLAQVKLEEERRKAKEEAKLSSANANCVYCGQPFNTATATAGEYGFCDDCADDD